MSNFGHVPGLLTSHSAIATEWLFDASAKTISVVEIGNALIVFVVNVTDGIVIYNPANPATTATQVNNRYVELVFDTTSMSDDDELLIFCELADVVDQNTELLKSIHEELRVHTAMMSEAWEIDVEDIEGN